MNIVFEIFALSCLLLPKYNDGKLNFVYSKSSENEQFPETVFWLLYNNALKGEEWSNLSQK